MKLNACQKVWSNWKCFEWNPKVCPELNRLETRAGTTWQIRFVSAPPPSSILIFFSALFREVHNQRKRELKLPFAASQRAAFPLPISLQCDVTGSPNLITLRLIIHKGELYKCAILLLMLQHCSLTLLPPHGCEILHEEDFFVISQHINHSTLCTDVLSVPPSNLCHSQSTN